MENVRTTSLYVRHGVGAVRPYIHGPVALWDFVKAVFSAEEVERHEFDATKFHIEARIGDAIIVLETGDPPDASGSPNQIYVYVPDVDSAYERALELGAQSLEAPSDKTYCERSAGVRDMYGNTWW